MLHFLKKFLQRSFKTLNTISISREAILGNLDLYQSLRPDSSIFPVLKSNAYGHGIREVASILTDRKLDYIVVDSYYEALEIRSVNKTHVLLIGYTLPSNFSSMDFSFVTPVISDMESLRALGETRKKIRIHLKIDTGMHRQWIDPEEILEFLEVLKKYPNISLEGVCTHLSDTDNVDNTSTFEQVQKFQQSIDQIQSEGFHLRYIHVANSAGGAKELPSVFNSMRLGIGLYGINPLEPSDPSYERLSWLRPALQFESTLVLKKKLRKGDQVSYNGTFTAPEDMTVGIIPVGYYEWIPRSLGEGKFGYTWKDEYFPILGRVCMNMTVVDLGKSPIEVGEKVLIISDDPSAPNSVYIMAHTAGTIPYECLTGLAESVRRRVL